MELSPNTLEHCQFLALGQVLSDWSDLTFEQVMTVLEENPPFEQVEDDRITVWQPFEDYEAGELIELIEQNLEAIKGFSTAIIEENK